jgi:hypothetical protein
MSLFARLSGSQVFEPQPNLSVAEYIARFDAFVVATWGPSPVISQVADGVQHGALFAGGDPTNIANFTNPSAAPMSPRVLSWSEFSSYLVGLLGGGDTGTAALQALLEAANTHTGTTTNDKLTRYFYTWFLGMTSFTKADTAARLVSLVATSIITQNQANAVASNWPSG